MPAMWDKRSLALAILAGAACGLAVGVLFGLAQGIGYLEAGRFAHALVEARAPAFVGAAAGGLAGVLLSAVVALARRAGLGRHAARAAAVAAVAGPLAWYGSQWAYVRTFRGRPGTIEWVWFAVAGVLLLASAAWVARGPRRSGALAAGTVAAVGALALAALPWATSARPSSGRPNGILIVVDALRADALGIAGYSRPTTPNLDALAREGVWFSQAVTQATFTKASIASLFTGLVPHHHGVYEGNLADRDDRITSDVLRADTPTLATRLARAGWTTVAFVQQAHLASYMGFGRGFAAYHEGQGRLPRINDRFVGWLERHGRIGPFWAYVHYIDLHDPYHPAPPWDRAFGDGPNPYAKCPTTSWKECLEGINSGAIRLDDAELARLRQLYDGLVASIDAEIGRLVARLRELGLYDDTLIVVTADHGDGFLEHGFISHSTLPYDELARVPLIVKLPRGGRAGVRVDAQVRLIDVKPTVLEALGAPVPDGLDGTSLVPMIDVVGPGPGRIAVTEYDGGLAVRTPTAKLLFGLDGRRECYDLTADPAERTNLWPACPAEIPELERTARQAIGARLAREKGPRIEVDPRTIEELRSLGYVR